MNDRTWRRIQTEVEPALSVASDGSAAVERARALKQNVVLMDLAMSGTGGLEISRALELDGPTTRVFVIAVTGATYDAQGALEAGCAGYLVQPAAAGPALDVISRMLRTHA